MLHLCHSSHLLAMEKLGIMKALPFTPIQRGILEELNHYLRSSLVPSLPDPRNVNTGPQEIQGCSWVKPARRQKKADLQLESTQPLGSTQTHGSVSKHHEYCEERNICKCKNRIH